MQMSISAIPDGPGRPVMRLARVSTAMLAALLLAACATTPEPEREAAAREQSLDPRSVVEHGVDNEAVVALWQRAEEAGAEGETAAAIAAIERALEMTPDDPVLLSRLAELRLQAGGASAAEHLAVRSNSLASGEHRLLLYRNWLIIEAARRRQGDGEGADAARTEIERLRAGR